jgi:hypothetical protein
VCRETLERWQAWHARAHVRQSFWTPGHAKRCATSFADDLVPGCDRSWIVVPWKGACGNWGENGRSKKQKKEGNLGQ